MRARSNNETREDIIGQIAVSKMYGDTFRDDLLQKLPDAFARARGKITFKFGNKKWFATREGEIIQVATDKKYSCNFDLKPGDVFVWGDHNWFCTCVGNVIVNMEKYMDNGKVIKFNYERSKGSMNFQHAKSHEPNHRNIGSNGNVSGLSVIHGCHLRQ